MLVFCFLFGVLLFYFGLIDPDFVCSCFLMNSLMILKSVGIAWECCCLLYVADVFGLIRGVGPLIGEVIISVFRLKVRSFKRKIWGVRGVSSVIVVNL